MPHEHSFAILGAAVAMFLAAGVLLAVILGALLLVARYWPRFHVGHPQNVVTLQTHSWDQIVTGKKGERLEPTEPKLIQKLGIKWWVGMSSRNRASWFFGLMSVNSLES